MSFPLFSLFRRNKNSQHQSSELPEARVIERDSHSISRRNISPNALKVLYRLGDAGFDAYLVGGCVRDLLLDKRPKDFDVATNATPEQIKKTFRNARIIGRRFKIVHIRFGREIIEVTTFRGFHEESTEMDRASRRKLGDLDSAHSSSGLILRDNVYGSIEQDAMRRDFTVNALYYSLDGFCILDFCDGMADLEARQLRIIGDAEARYREDPVRMLRAIRFAAKLGFDIDRGTEEPIDRLSELLIAISPARLFDETVKLFSGGQALDTFELLIEYRLAQFLLGPIHSAFRDEDTPASAKRLLELALTNTDKRIAEDKSVTPAFLFAALLWPVLQRQLQDRLASGKSLDFPSLQSAANSVIYQQLEVTAIPKRFSFAAREIWELQLRLERRNKRSVESCFSHPRFRAAYDFLLLREEAGEDLGGSGDWWTQFQLGDNEERNSMIEQASPAPGRRRKRRRRRPSKESS